MRTLSILLLCFAVSSYAQIAGSVNEPAPIQPPADGENYDQTLEGEDQASPNAGLEVPVIDTRPQTVAAPTRRNPSPEMELLSPIGRKDVDLARTPLKPCGGTNSGTVHFETTPGSRNMFAWKIVHPSPTGNCTVRVGDAPTEKALKVVKPTDGSAHENGSFPCGRTEAQYEGKEFKIPTTLECDTCVVQIEWETEKGTQHMCSDFMSIGTEIPECFGQCLNGGTCANGKCACPPYFSGTNCQIEDPNRDSGVVAGPSILDTLGEDAWILIVYAVMLALIAGFLIGAYILYKMAEAKRAQMSEEDQKLLDGRGDKLTSDKSGEPMGKSTYMQDE